MNDVERDESAGRAPGFTSAEIDETFVPQIAPGLESVRVGDELVVLDNRHLAQVLSPLGAAIWSRLDGTISLGEIAWRLTDEGAAGAVADEVVAFVRQLGSLGLLAGVTPGGTSEIHLEPIPDPQVGDEFPPFSARDLNGVLRDSRDLLGGELLLINWNSHCGFCAGIATSLGELEAPLADAGTTMILIATGDAESNASLLERSGITSSVLIVEDSLPFGSVGTPSAVALDASGRIRLPPAHGAGAVLDLVRTAAGLESEPDGPDRGDGPRYLFERHSVCAPVPGGDGDRQWAGSQVFRIAGHHVGIRGDGDATLEVLGALFAGARVDDPRAGHSFSVALPDIAHGRYHRANAGWNLLVQPGRTDLRSRDPARVLQGLLARVREAIDDPASPCREGRARVNAIPVRTPEGGIGLIPANFYAFGPRLQPLLARKGLALVDCRFPQIELRTAEVVIPAPNIEVDERVLSAVAADRDLGRGELPAVLPGTYPLIGCCFLFPGPSSVVPLSAAQAAAAAISIVATPGTTAERLVELARLFERIPADGIWYFSDTEAIDLVAQVLSVS